MLEGATKKRWLGLQSVEESKKAKVRSMLKHLTAVSNFSSASTLTNITLFLLPDKKALYSFAGVSGFVPPPP